MAQIREAKKKSFVTELQAKYTKLYSSIRPVPHERQRMYCINNLLVEGGIECMSISKPGEETRNPLGAFKDTFRGKRIKSTRRVLQGQPGYGKSMVALNLVYEWCTKDKDSPIRDVEILIYLRLRELGGVPSIYRAIKWFLLPAETCLSEKDIEGVLHNASSVLVLLDGHDEYPDKDSPAGNDVRRIMRAQLLPNADVTLTARYIPEEFAFIASRLQLTGFNEEMRDHYISRVAAQGNETTAGRIKQVLRENPILGDMCRAPLLLAMIAHTSSEQQPPVTTSSVTKFARGFVSCFKNHAVSKAKDDGRSLLFIEDKDRKLGKVAMDGLRQYSYVWEREELIDQLGKQLYDQYVAIGFLVECNKHDPVASDLFRAVRFFHRVLLEWFAAEYISLILSRDGAKLYTPDEMESYDVTNDESQCLDMLDPIDVQFLFCFACGMNAGAAKNLQEYLLRVGECEKLAVLCMMEQEGQHEAAMKELEKYCTEDIRMSRYDEDLRLTVTIKFLECASRHNIPIVFTWLHENFEAVSPGGDEIRVISGHIIRPFDTVQEFWVEAPEKVITTEEFDGLLMYAMKCPQLKKLKFIHTVLPESSNAEEARAALLARGVEVQQGPITVWFNFNLEGNFWEFKVGNTRVKDKEYRHLVQRYREFYYLT